MTVRQRDLRECGASLDEAGGLTDLPQMIGSVRVVAVLIEQEDGTTKISLRSKAEAAGMTDVVDVNKAARTLGGGGHKHAAGADWMWVWTRRGEGCWRRSRGRCDAAGAHAWRAG
ncbi:MAG: DHHA1 domain-containing protein [Phycisphaerales bacterium]